MLGNCTNGRARFAVAAIRWEKTILASNCFVELTGEGTISFNKIYIARNESGVDASRLLLAKIDSAVICAINKCQLQCLCFAMSCTRRAGTIRINVMRQDCFAVCLATNIFIENRKFLKCHFVR